MKYDLVISEAATLDIRTNRVVWDLADSSPSAVALGVALLYHELIESLTVRANKGRWALRMRASGSARDSHLSLYGDRRVELALSHAALRNWLAFFLIYHRDGQAEVDHLDLETAWTTGESCDFTLKVAAFAPPMSIDEARRLLGLPDK